MPGLHMERTSPFLVSGTTTLNALPSSDVFNKIISARSRFAPVLLFMCACISSLVYVLDTLPIYSSVFFVLGYFSGNGPLLPVLCTKTGGGCVPVLDFADVSLLCVTVVGCEVFIDVVLVAFVCIFCCFDLVFDAKISPKSSPLNNITFVHSSSCLSLSLILLFSSFSNITSCSKVFTLLFNNSLLFVSLHFGPPEAVLFVMED